MVCVDVPGHGNGLALGDVKASHRASGGALDPESLALRCPHAHATIRMAAHHRQAHVAAIEFDELDDETIDLVLFCIGVNVAVVRRRGPRLLGVVAVRILKRDERHLVPPTDGDVELFIAPASNAGQARCCAASASAE